MENILKDPERKNTLHDYGEPIIEVVHLKKSFGKNQV